MSNCLSASHPRDFDFQLQSFGRPVSVCRPVHRTRYLHASFYSPVPFLLSQPGIIQTSLLQKSSLNSKYEKNKIYSIESAIRLQPVSLHPPHHFEYWFLNVRGFECYWGWWDFNCLVTEIYFTRSYTISNLTRLLNWPIIPFWITNNENTFKENMLLRWWKSVKFHLRSKYVKWLPSLM